MAVIDDQGGSPYNRELTGFHLLAFLLAQSPCKNFSEVLKTQEIAHGLEHRQKIEQDLLEDLDTDSSIDELLKFLDNHPKITEVIKRNPSTEELWTKAQSSA